ncbi:hypothetical protein ACJMK2_018419, partial [Sinanodonta woodiana]
QGKYQKNVTEDMATTSTPGLTIHRIKMPALPDMTTSYTDMVSVSTAKLETFQ